MLTSRSSRTRSRRRILALSAVAAAAATAAGSFGGRAARALDYQWDPGQTPAAPSGGTGTWNTTSAFWTTDLANDVPWPNSTADTATFGGVPGTVTLNNGGATTQAGGITFATSGYRVIPNAAGDTLTLGGAGPFVTVAPAGGVATLNPILVGSAGLTFNGPGVLTLGGLNTYTGQTTITAGALVQAAVSSTAAGNGAFGAGGAGNELIVQAGGTLSTGGHTVSLAAGTKSVRIAGTGVGGLGAILNAGNATANNQAFSSVALTADATVNTVGTAISAVPNGFARTDLRLGVLTAGAENLDLNGNTLTKIGGGAFVLVNADVSAGNVVVDDGIFVVESGTTFNTTGSSITVNGGARLGFFSLSGASAIPAITVNDGGSVGEWSTTGAAQTVGAATTLSLNGAAELFAGSANGPTFAGVVSSSGGATVAKRGAGSIYLTNANNSFAAPVTVYQGTLRADFGAPAAGGTPAAPTALAGTPLGTASTLTIAGGTLTLRFNAAGDNTTIEYASLARDLVVDRAPSGMVLDRISGARTNKNLTPGTLTFAAASAANGWSVGQNQFTFTQGSEHRLFFNNPVTLNNDAVFVTGDFTFNGNIAAPGGHSLAKTGGNSWGFVNGSAANGFNALFHVTGGSSNLRVGSMYGTAVVSNTATAGTGPIVVNHGTNNTWRSPTNIAAGQTIEAVSQQQAQALVNFEMNSATPAQQTVPAALRALGPGVLGVSGANAFQTIDLSRLGDGNWRVGANAAGASSSGTVAGAVLPGKPATPAFGVAPDGPALVRLGATGTTTLSAANALSGDAGLEVGSALINGGFRTVGPGNQNGTVLLSQANAYAGGTTVNRGSVLRFQAGAGALGTGAVTAFGTVTAEAAGATAAGGRFFRADSSPYSVATLGGSTVRLDNTVLTNAADVDRWGDAVPVSLTNATFELTNRNNASVTAETIGDLSFAGGSTLFANRLTNTGGTSPLRLITGALTRVGTGTLEMPRAANSGFGAAANGTNITVTNAPASTNGMVAPYLVLNDATRHNIFADYVPANGHFTTAVYTQQINTATFPAGLSNAGIYYVDFAAGVTTTTLSDNPDVYALKVGGGTGTTNIAASGGNNTVTIRSGGLIFSGDATAGNFSTDGTRTVNVAPALVFNNGAANVEALVNTRNAFTANLNGAVTAAGLTKFGAGTLNLFANNASTLAGTVSVNQGTLQLFGPATSVTHAPAGTGTILLAGGQLNLRSNNTAVTGTINPTLPQGVEVAANIPVATIDSNRSGADTASSGTFTFNPTAAGPGLVLSGSPGPQGQTLTVSGGNYGVAFGANGLNTFNGNVTVNNTITLTLANAPTINGTSPVVTKSGGGTLVIGTNTPNAPSVAAGTTVVVNAGTLELRNNTLAFPATGSVDSLGTGATTSLVLNAGTLNLRRELGGTTNGGFGGATNATAYPVTVNGNTTINVDRISASTNQGLALGTLTVNGNPTVTFTAGNGFYPTFGGARLNGSPVLNSGVGPGSVDGGVRFNGDVAGGALVKSGTGHVHLLSANNSYDGGTYINQGVVRARATNALGTGGDVFLNPGAVLDLNSATNFNPASQTIVVRGNAALPPMISMNAGVAHPTAGVDATNAPTGIIGLSNGTGGTFNAALDLSTMYGGGWHLGGLSSGAYDGRYTAATLGAGSGNTYRFGGGGLAFVIGQSSTNTVHTNLLTGPNGVQAGFDSGNALSVTGGTFYLGIVGTHNFTGDTVVHRGTPARLVAQAVASGGRNLSGLSDTEVDVFGYLQLAGQATMHVANAATNAVTFHPGSALVLDNNGGTGNGNGTLAAANITNRWGDTTPIALDGAQIDFIGNNNAASTETVGAVSFSRGAAIRFARNGTGTTTLTLGGLTGFAPGNSLILRANAGNMGSAAASGDRVIVSSGPPAVVNGMVDPRVVSFGDNAFVTYGATNGFAAVTYDNVVNGGTYAPGALNFNPATTTGGKVNVTTAALTLTDNPAVYALATNQTINIGGPFNTITIRGGGFIGNGGTINPNLVFHDGTNPIEARVFVGAATTLNNGITANGITKFGNGTLTINQAQPAHATGWTVNTGALSILDAQGLGQSVPGNAITLNATQTTTGTAANGYTATQLILQRDSGSPEPVTFTGGPITVVNEAIVRVTSTAAGTGTDRSFAIPALTAQSTGPARAALTWDVPGSRNRVATPSLTLAGDALLRLYDSNSTGDTGRSTTGAVASLVGTADNLTKTGNRILELSGDNSATFTGGSITASQGAVRVLHNGALGSASTTATFEWNAALEVGVSNFNPVATLAQRPGSIERWNVQDARGATTYNLPAGVNLQLNTNLLNTQTIGLNGGTIEGFLYTDHPVQAALRTVGPNVTINLLADSYVGQNVLQGVTYDAGRQPTVYQPFAGNVTGTYLEIEGNITGAGDLTKTGLDTVTLSGPDNAYGDTTVDMGVLRIGVADGLPTGGTLATRLAGTFDLYGFDQTVAGLGTPAAGPNPGGVGVGSSGRVVNSAPYDNTLTVNAAADFTYNGTIEQAVALTKSAGGTLDLGASDSTYVGATTVAGGVVRISTIANGGAVSSIGASTAAAANLVLANGGTLAYASSAPGSTDRLLTLGAGGGGIDSSSPLAANALAFTATGAVVHAAPAGTPRTLTLGGTNAGANTFNLTLADNGAGPASLTKAGAGSWTITGVHTYTGPTTVAAGTLFLGATAGIAQSVTIDVQASGTLDVTANVGFTVGAAQTIQGTGLVDGAVSVVGKLAPGASPGKLTFRSANGLTLANGSLFEVEVGKSIAGEVPTPGDDYDQAALTAATGTTVTITSGARLRVIDLPNLEVNDVFTIIDNASTGTLAGAGNFVDANNANAALPEGGTVFGSLGSQYTISYLNNDVTLTTVVAVPEPAAVVGAAVLAASGLLSRRRRRREHAG